MILHHSYTEGRVEVIASVACVEAPSPFQYCSGCVVGASEKLQGRGDALLCKV